MDATAAAWRLDKPLEAISGGYKPVRGSLGPDTTVWLTVPAPYPGSSASLRQGYELHLPKLIGIPPPRCMRHRFVALHLNMAPSHAPGFHRYLASKTKGPGRRHGIPHHHPLRPSQPARHRAAWCLMMMMNCLQVHGPTA